LGEERGVECWRELRDQPPEFPLLGLPDFRRLIELGRPASARRPIAQVRVLTPTDMLLLIC
jgi:hypothetical protein